MSDKARARKLADRIKVVVAETLERRVKDPRLGFITVTDTRVTGDLQHATVFYTVFGDDTEKAATAAALESAKGKLRSEVGKAVGIRLTPSLEFVPDAVPENAASIADLLRTAAAKDAEVAALAQGKTYAGEPDPYRHPELDDVAPDEDDDEDDDDDDDWTRPTTPPRTTTTRRRRGRGPRVSGPPAGGLVLVDKPAGWTSHDVVARVRRLASTRRVGHAGTLDPMATGVLVLGVDRATKLLTYLVGADKTYTATVRLGVATVTDDAEGEPTAVRDAAGVDEPAVRAAVGRPDRSDPAGAERRQRDQGRRQAVVRAGAGGGGRRARRPPGHRPPVRGARRCVRPSTRAPRCSTSTSRWSARPAPTCGRWRATSAPPSASAVTSRRCGAPGWARTGSTGAAPWTSSPPTSRCCRPPTPRGRRSPSAS